MALKPTIYKFNIALADLNHQHYPNLQLTIAQHPSETKERMLLRLLVYCLHSHENSDERMTFTKGLSATDEPDIWHKSYDGQVTLWIDIGEPSFERMKKVCRLAKQTYIYSFNSKSALWWKQNQAQLSDLPVKVFSFEWSQIQALAEQIERTASWSITISEQALFVTTDAMQLEATWHQLQ